MPRADPKVASRAFGDRIREERGRKGLTQDALAHRAGLQTSIIARLERGGRDPRLTTMMAVASGLGISLAELLEGEF
jgi:transcriptional regulator with XRE-family HTH domain